MVHQRILGYAVALVGFALPASASVTVSKSNACQVLSDAGLREQLYFADDVEFGDALKTYYAQDVTDIKPSCIFQPGTVEDVSNAVKALKKADVKDIAVRSGGHSPYPNNNIQGGVTIDLSRLDFVKLRSYSPTQPIVSLGSGGRWGHVYDVLAKEGIAIAGAREGHVGVGGFLLGGGMSWFTARVGFSVDNIVGYEIVLADGSIKRITKNSNADLFKALKGGLNNFGIVTKFIMKAFPASEVFGGLSVHPFERRVDVAQNFVNMISRHNNAEGGFVTYSWSPVRAPSVAYITANIDGDENSPSFVDIPKMDPFIDSRAKQSLGDLTKVIASTSGLYNVWYTLTFDATMDMAKKVIDTFEGVVAELDGQIDEPVTIIFLMTTLSKSYVRSGNILGLDKSLKRDGIVFQAEALLPSTKYRALMDAKLQAANAEIERYARSTKQDTLWRYINYANPIDDPFQGYGQQNLEYLRRISKKYDPQGFFQKNVPGGFKLFKYNRGP